jgi:hypothetical protein
MQEYEKCEGILESDLGHNYSTKTKICDRIETFSRLGLQPKPMLDYLEDDGDVDEDDTISP